MSKSIWRPDAEGNDPWATFLTPRVGRLFGCDVRVHWTLLAVSLFQISQGMRFGLPWWMILIMALVPLVSVLAHEFGHVFMTRLVGGEARLVVLWMFGGFATCSYPRSPGRQFAVSAAGPLVNFMIMAVCLLIMGNVQLSFLNALNYDAVAGTILGSFATCNFTLLIFNLLPCHPLDGGSMFEAACWPIFGLRRATIYSIYSSYVCLAGLFALAILWGSIFLFILSLSFLVTVITMQRGLNQDSDPYLGGVPAGEPLGPGWYARWKAKRARRQQEQRDAAEHQEQEVLDRLLSKVSEQGLPSLTAAERRMLKAISERQKRRLNSPA